MDKQVRLDINNAPFILHGLSVTENDVTLSQDAGRSVVLGYGTLMAKIAATKKWEPFTDETATDGTAIPLGILVSADVAAADLVAGDVLNQTILIGGNVLIDDSQLIIENSKTLDTVINATGAADNILIQTVKDYLYKIGIYPESTVAISEFENA